VSDASTGRLTIVGLGPGTWEGLTVEAVSVLSHVSELYVRDPRHPAIATIVEHLPGLAVRSIEPTPVAPHQDTEDAAIESLLVFARDAGGVVYAVPGNPGAGRPSVGRLRERASELGVSVRIVAGLSETDAILSALGVFAGWVESIDAAEAARFGRENAVGQSPGDESVLPWRSPVPTQPLIVSRLGDGDRLAAVQTWLRRYYPDDHLVHVVWEPGTSDCRSRSLPLCRLDRIDGVDGLTGLYIPPLPALDDVRTFAGLMSVTRRLRAPGGCPWDREQTHASLKPYLLEEAYEAIDALDSGDPQVLAEELGDLLYQITIHSQVAAEHGEFTVEDVFQHITCKMIGRHPHVFGELQLESAQDVLRAWEGLKQRQKPSRASILEEIPKALPSLPQSSLIQKRAASVGFEWPALIDVLSKVEEELRELYREVYESSPRERQLDELGDIFFALVSVGRHLKIDPEEALRLANRKFAARFSYVESRTLAAGKSLRDLSAAELDALWNEAKQAVEPPTA